MRKNMKLAYMAVAVSAAMILGYIEALIPFDFGIPGAKMGLANAAVITVLYMLGRKAAVCVSFVRIALSAAVFGNAFSFLYSAAGAALSLTGMILLMRTNKFGIVGVSTVGGVLHNIGQLIVAMCVTDTAGLAYYAPLLAVAGIAAGICMGALSAIIIKRLKHGIG